MSAASSSSDIPVCAECSTEEDEISAVKNKKECTSCEQNFNEGAPCTLMNDMSISNGIPADISTCANCGKEGSDVTNICNRCETVKYCNAACKKKHRSKHKKKCDRRIAELHDEQLFKQPPPIFEDCPICMIRLPTFHSGSMYMFCCGKTICSGCVHAVRTRDGRVGLCPFCRTPTPTSDEEIIGYTKKRVEVGDAEAIFNLGCDHRDGEYGVLQNYAKALELWHRAAELDYPLAYNNIGCAYNHGEGVQVDKKKAKHYYELSAMAGNVLARHSLGRIEERLGNVDRAVKHYTIAARDGNCDSVKNIQDLYMKGSATKDGYTKALHAYQEYLNEIKSLQRDRAAADDEENKYYE